MSHEHEHHNSCSCCCHEHDHCHGDCSCHEDHEHHDHCHDEGCGCCHHHSEEPVSRRIIKLIPSAVILVFSFFIPEDKAMLSTILLLLAFVFVGYETVFSAIKTLIKERSVDEAFLMSIASVGAIAVGEIKEAVAVMLFYSIGQILEEEAQNRSKKSIRALMDLHPDIVTVKRDGELIKLEPESVKVGDIIVVLPGERIPLDGVITEGTASVDYSALTGESLPVTAESGREVYGGGINLSTAIEVKATKPYAQSSSARIIAMVEDARSKKAKSEKFISKFSKKYTLIVCLTALVVAFVFPIFTGYAETFTRWLYTGLTFLVVSCPCALVISVPLTFFAGLGCASAHGILIKSTASIETLAKLRSVAMDKTGTVTKGSLSLTKTTITDNNYAVIAIAESKSNHPAAKSFVDNAKSSVDTELCTEITELPGKGISAKVSGKEVLAGNSTLMAEYSIAFEDVQEAGVIIHTAIDGVYTGYAVFEDEIKSDSAEAVAYMNKLGIKRIAMLTGDKHSNGESVCRQVGIAELHAELSPEDKCSYLERIITETTDGSTAFVGDGINDAPVLSLADVGIAMGGLGSDSAIETADVVILDDSLSKLPKAVKLSKRTLSIVWQNIIFALGAKILVMILSIFNAADMWMAVFADIGVMLIAVINALRALKYRD